MKELSLNNKIEKAIRFQDFEESIKQCTDIANKHAHDMFLELDRKLYLMDKNQDNLEVHHLIVEIRAKLLFPYIQKTAID
jgi:Holliday junction resolvasome RuvABC DNA-binding subunit